ncbi:MAG: putative hydrolase, alpha/beta fold family protein [Rubrobacteraceae bacterium]|jgi:pimeloyl-ACP methyl ester carboxylesterase|nr:putative hydrolase, alpha/beta fold family protein [Rubrobacteraceae bacterium]
MVAAGTHIEANGLRIYYEVHGEGEPLLLVHGGTATSQSWASHLPAFTERYPVQCHRHGGRSGDAAA